MKGELLSLVAIGKERVQSKNHGKPSFKQETQFLHVNAVLQDMRGKTVKAGNYVYPFSIHLPDSLPASMSSSGGRVEAQIQYKIAATFGKTHFDRVFGVTSRPLPPTMVPCFVEPKTEAIKAMGLRTVGSVTFGAMVRDAHVGRGNTLSLAVACRNDSTVDIRRVEFKLIELITLSPKNQVPFQDKTTLLHCEDIALPGLIKGKSTRTAINQRQRSIDFHETNYAAIYDALLHDSNTIEIPVPARSRDTHKGGIIKVEHYLKIKLHTNAFTDNVSIKIPLQIGNASTSTPLPPEAVASGTMVVDSEAVPPPLVPADSYVDRPASPAEIPFVSAVLLDIPPESEVTVAPVVEATATILSPSAPVERDVRQETDEGNDGHRYEEEEDYNEFATPSAPLTEDGPPCLSTLLSEMLTTVNDYTIVQSKINTSKWKEFFESLSPEDFGSIIAHVRQPTRVCDVSQF